MFVKKVMLFDIKVLVLSATHLRKSSIGEEGLMNACHLSCHATGECAGNNGIVNVLLVMNDLNEFKNVLCHSSHLWIKCLSHGRERCVSSRDRPIIGRANYWRRYSAF